MAGGTWVVVGLGNPGKRYAETRHNVGFRLVDRLARDFRALEEEDSGLYRVRWGLAGDDRVALVKPMTYMNRSGEALLRFPESAVAGPSRHLIALDDVDLPFGAIRFRSRGSSGGHRGLESILGALGTQEVPRLRLGVGDVAAGGDVAEHVLETFSEEEEKAIGPWLARVSEGVRVFLLEGPAEAMNRFNRPAGEP